MTHASAIASVYSAYMDSMYAYALHLGFDEHKAMDAIHDVFYKLCVSHSSLKEISNPKFYLFRALKNRLIDMQRSEKEYTGIPASKEEMGANMSFQLHVTVEDDLINEEEREDIRRQVENVLSNLTDRQREIIYLRYIQECDYEEIAELMQISVAACRNLISKSISKLKDSSLPLAQLLIILSHSAMNC